MQAQSGVYGNHQLQPGMKVTLGRGDMQQPHNGVSRQQCMFEVGFDGSAYLVSKGKPPTGLFRNGAWYSLDTDERQRLYDGDQVSLDCYNPENALFWCQVMQGGGGQQGYGQQGGYGQQQGGYGQQGGGYGQQGGYGGQQGGYGQQGGGYGQQGGGYGPGR